MFFPIFCFVQKNFFLFFLPNTGESPSDLGIKAENSLLPPSPPPHLQPMTISVTDRRREIRSSLPVLRCGEKKITFHYIYFFVFFIREGGCSSGCIVFGSELLSGDGGGWIFSPTREVCLKKKKMVQHRKMIWK